MSSNFKAIIRKLYFLVWWKARQRAPHATPHLSASRYRTFSTCWTASARTVQYSQVSGAGDARGRLVCFDVIGGTKPVTAYNGYVVELLSCIFRVWSAVQNSESFLAIISELTGVSTSWRRSRVASCWSPPTRLASTSSTWSQAGSNTR